MPTIIYPTPIFGPVKSRRLGISLGINLQPGDGKICTFDCIYCECGFNADNIPQQPRPTRKEVKEKLEQVLWKMRSEEQQLDDITFAGNGEPTAHPDFEGIVADTVDLRDEYYPEAKLSVLSNSTFIHKPSVRNALLMVDNNILKLDTVSPEYINRADRPTSKRYDVKEIIEGMKAFNGHAIIQTMFMKGRDMEGRDIDNTGPEYVDPWLKAVEYIKPGSVMVYTIDRKTPDHNLQKASHEELDAIRDKVVAMGIPCTASY